MAEGKKSFVLYHELLDTVETIPDDSAGKLFKEILRYVNGVESKETDPMAKALFSLIKNGIDRNTAKWEAKAAANKENGKKGGRPRKDEEEPMETQNNPVGLLETQENPTKSVNVPVNVPEPVNENVNVIKKNFSEKPYLSPNKSKPSKSSSMTSEHLTLYSTTMAATDVQTSITHPALAAALITFFDYQKEMGLKINKFTVKASIEKALAMAPEDAIESINTAMSGNFPTFLSKTTQSGKPPKETSVHVDSRMADYDEQ